jgi:prepilin-type processing-associated H-X9-DG protein
LPVANQYFARSDYVYNVGWNDSGMPITVNYDNTVTGCNGPIYRNSHISYAGVTDGLSNTVVGGERTPYLSDATWVGIIPGYRHFAYNAFASLGTGGLGVNYDYASAILAAHSGPSLYEDPVVIHPPNSPLGHTDEMYALHPGGANVLMGDGSVRFIKQAINLLTWSGLSSRSNGEVISADSY